MAFTENGVTITNYFAKISDYSAYLPLGGAQAFGNNSYGQLGSGNKTAYSSPVTVQSSYNWNDAVILRSGQGTAFINQDNKLYCSGDLSSKSTFGPIKSTQLWNKISCSYYNVAAIDSNNQLYTWGSNTYGELGLSDLTQRQVPTLLSGNWTTVSAGPNSTYAIKSDGTFWAWGYNNYGQLGNFDTTNRSSPIIIGSAINSWKQTSTGGDITLAIQTNGTLWAWGNNANGQLGLSDTIVRYSPTQVGNLSYWSQVSTGDAHSLAIQSNGTLWAWGSNNYGQLGITTAAASISTPTQVGNSSNWSKVLCGQVHTAALKSDGTLWTWGSNVYGQLGLSDTTNRSSPTQVGNLTNWNKIGVGGRSTYGIKTDGTLWSMGESGSSGTGFIAYSPIQIGNNSWIHVAGGWLDAFAIQADGSLWAWGNINSWGQLGLNTRTGVNTPVQVGTSSNWIQVSCGYYTTQAMQSDGTLWTWGNNSYGQLGLSDQTHRYVPTQVGVLSNWTLSKSFSAPTCRHTALINSNATLFEFGVNSYGQLGQLDIISRLVPTQLGVGIYSNWAQVCAGAYSSLALNSLGQLWTAGYNLYGQLGNNSTSSMSTYVQVGSLNSWTAVSSSRNKGYSAGAILSDGTTWLWGNNSFGQLGQNNQFNYTSPVLVGNLVNVNTWRYVAAAQSAYQFVTAIKSDGTLWAWGVNSYGQLGSGDYTHRSSPTQVSAESNWVSVHPSSVTTFALKDDNTLWAVGLNEQGSMGVTIVPSNTKTSSFVQVLGSWKAVAPGTQTTAGIKTDGTLWTWGFNNYGSMGISVAFISTPIQIGTASNWAEVARGGFHVMAINSIGQLWVAGSNSYGQLGLNTSTATASSITQLGTDTNWSKVFGCGYASIALKTNGTLWAWGQGTYGQLGLSDNLNRSSPTQIGALSNWTKLAGNRLSTVAIKDDGTMWAWGLSAGLFGNNTNTSYFYSPVQIGNNLSNWVQASAGSCLYAIDSSGVMYTAGDNSWGQLGSNNQGAPSSILTQVGGIGTLLTNCADIAFGSGHTVILTSNGTLWSVGSNAYGQLGLNDITNRSLITQVGTSSNWTKVVCDNLSTIAVKSDGTMWAWGVNSNRQLALGDLTHRSSPTQIGTLSNWSSPMNAGPTVFAIDSNSTLWSVGASSYSALGISQYMNTSVPSIYSQQTMSNLSTSEYGAYALDYLNKTIVQTSDDDIPFIDPSNSLQWKTFSTGSNHFVGVNTNGTAWAIGSNYYGQLGLSDSVYRRSLTQIGSRSDWSKVYCADYGTMLIDNSMNGWVFGKNNKGQLGTSDTVNRYSPVQVLFNRSWDQIANGENHSVAIKSNGTLWSWGYNTSGQLGVSSVTSRSSPIQVDSIDNWKQVSANKSYSMAVKKDGTLWGWGEGTSGQLGLKDLTNRYVPTQVGLLSVWTTVGNGFYHTLAIQTNGTLWAWGQNDIGQLGLSDTIRRSSPVQVGTSSNWSKVSASYGSTLALKTDGTLWAWGWNDTGNLAFNDTTNRSTPTQIGLSSNWSEIGSQILGTFAIKTDGTLWSCGYNGQGQLGLGDTTDRSSLVQVGSDTNWSKVYCGYQHVIAVKTNGTLWGWGNNVQGQLGLSDTDNRSSPTQIGNSSNWSKISCGYWNSNAINSSTSLFAWGGNGSGQLGISNTTNRSTPTQVGVNDQVYSASVDDTNTWIIDGDKNLWESGANNNNATFNSKISKSSSFIQIGSLTSWSDVFGSKGGVSGTFAYAIKNDGTLWGWGKIDAWMGDLGNLGSSVERYSPIQIGTDSNWSKLTLKNATAIGIKTDGSLWSWGENQLGELGQNATTLSIYTPRQVGALTDWSKVSLGGYHAAAVKTDGTLWTWGSNSFGQGGRAIGGPTRSPIQVGTDTNWSNVSCGDTATLISKTDGTLWALGYNLGGSLGISATGPVSSPTQVLSAGAWSDNFSVSYEMGAGIKADGSLWAWGKSANGEFGLVTIGRIMPTQISSGPWSQVHVGRNFVAAVLSNGKVLCTMGNNGNGQLGANTSTAVVPSLITISGGWKVIGTGLFNTYGIKEDGSVWSVGNNANGELGAFATYPYFTQKSVTNDTYNTVSSNGDNTLLTKTNGSVWAVGNNSYGTLGVNTTTAYSSPVQIGSINNVVKVETKNNSSVFIIK